MLFSPRWLGMSARPLHVLFVGTRNSARSIMAEAMLHELGTHRFRAFSAGSDPAGTPDPLALTTLLRFGFPIEGLRSKSWHEFALDQSNAPPLHVVLTVCDDVARMPTPIWPGGPLTAHWPVPDPCRVTASNRQRLRAFNNAAAMLRDRIELLVNLPLDKLDDFALRLHLKDIGRESLLGLVR